MLHRENDKQNSLQILFLTKCQDMPRKTIASTLLVKQKEYKNAELVLCEFIAVQEYDVENPPTYQDFNLQEFHDFVADKIEALDPIINKPRWPYQTKQE